MSKLTKRVLITITAILTITIIFTIDKAIEMKVTALTYTNSYMYHTAEITNLFNHYKDEAVDGEVASSILDDKIKSINANKELYESQLWDRKESFNKVDDVLNSYAKVSELLKENKPVEDVLVELNNAFKESEEHIILLLK